jgi:hypothetical protein
MENTETNALLEELEEIQYVNLYSEDELPLKDISGKAIRLCFRFGFIIFLIILIIGIFIKIPIEQSFTFIFDSNQNEKIYRYKDFIHITKTIAAPGDTVMKNMALIEITSERISELILQYKLAKNELELFYANDTALFSDKMDILNYQIKIFNETKDFEQIALNLQTRQLTEEMQKLNFNSEEADRRYKLKEYLYHNGAISEIELKDYEKKKHSEKRNAQVTKFNYEKSIAERKSNIDIINVKEKYLEKEIEILIKEKKKKEKSLINQLEYSYNKLVLNYGRFIITESNKLILLADKKSIITYIHTSASEADEGEILLKLIDVKSKLYARTSIEPSRIGYIKKGQSAIMKVSTFPYYQWGVIKSKVQNISISPDIYGLYPIEFKITHLGQLRNHLKPGMTGEVSILTHEKTIFELLFSKLYAIKDDMQNMSRE